MTYATAQTFVGDILITIHNLFYNNQFLAYLGYLVVFCFIVTFFKWLISVFNPM